MFSKVLLAIILVATLIGLMWVWSPALFQNELASKLVWSFAVFSAGVSSATGVLQYIPD